MKKVYFIYVAIPEKIFNKIKYMLDKTDGYRWKKDKMFGLYAWTNSKSIAKEFFEVRNKNIYTLIKREIDDEEFERLKIDLISLRLERRRYYLSGTRVEDNSVEIVSTKNEFVCTTIESEEYLWEFGPPIVKEVPYNIFIDKVIDALDTLGYTKGYDLNYGVDGDRDSVSYNLSFGMTPLGKKDKIVYDNQMNILLYLFKFFFYGEPKLEVD